MPGGQHALGAQGAADGADRRSRAQTFHQRVITPAARHLHRAFAVARPEFKDKAGIIFQVAAEMGGEAHPRRINAQRRDGFQPRFHRRQRRIQLDAGRLQQSADFVHRLPRRTGNAEQLGDHPGDGGIKTQGGRFRAALHRAVDDFLAGASGTAAPVVFSSRASISARDGAFPAPWPRRRSRVST